MMSTLKAILMAALKRRDFVGNQSYTSNQGTIACLTFSPTLY